MESPTPNHTAELLRASSVSVDGLTGGSLDLADTVVHRVRMLSSICAASGLIYWLADAWFQPETAPVRQHPLFLVASLGLVVLAIVFAAFQFSGIFTKPTLAHIGLGVLTLQGLLMSVQENATLASSDGAVVGSPACAIWLVLCSVVVPFPRWAILGMSAVLIVAWPVTYWIPKEVLGLAFLGWNRIAVWVLPLLISAIWAPLLNRYLYRLVLKSRRADELGAYHLEYRLARGGMGEVWVARHRLLSRFTAVKVIRPEALQTHNMKTATVVRKRFEREAYATSTLRNPHTVSLYDFGVAKDGSFYYVMELLEGIDLQDLVQRFGPVHPGRVRNILIQVCESLAEAHSRGMVHRDIKPKNVFLCDLGWSHDFAKVLDFGLVKTLYHEGESVVTMDGSTAGTPAYLPPECALGEPTIDGRADLYALGCVGYFLLTGTTVFEETTPTAFAVAHVRKEPTRPSERSEMQIPRELEDVIMKCLEKRPERRPQTAFELAASLRAARGVPEFDADMAADWWAINRPNRPLAQSKAANDCFERTTQG